MQELRNYDGKKAAVILPETFNKVSITVEAAFDYEHCLFGGGHPTWEDCLRAAEGDQKKAFEYAGQFDAPTAKLDQIVLRSEVEEYINRQNIYGRLLYENRIRHKYFDEKSGRMLMLFLCRDKRFGAVQNWLLAGICFAEDWDADTESEAEIKDWLDCKITNLLDKDDWVVRARAGKIIDNTEKTLYEDVLKEVTNAFDDKRDKETAERLAFLQSVFFRFKGRRRVRKTGDRD